jgi:hypothetical protein
MVLGFRVSAENLCPKRSKEKTARNIRKNNRMFSRKYCTDPGKNNPRKQYIKMRFKPLFSSGLNYPKYKFNLKLYTIIHFDRIKKD